MITNKIPTMNTCTKLIAAAALAVTSALLPVSAQNLMFDNPDNKSYFGARVAVDFSSASNGALNYSSKAGFSAGAIYNMPVVKNFYFEPGLFFFYDVFGTSFVAEHKFPTVDADGNDVTGVKYYQVDGSLRNFGFRIPFNFGYHFDFDENIQVSVFTGPQLNLSLVARYHQNGVISPAPDSRVYDSASVSAFGTNGFKHVDLQWNIGVGVNYDHYYASVSGSIGATRMKSASVIPCGSFQAYFPTNIKRNIFNITVGYNF